MDELTRRAMLNAPSDAEILPLCDRWPEFKAVLIANLAEQGSDHGEYLDAVERVGRYVEERAKTIRGRI